MLRARFGNRNEPINGGLYGFRPPLGSPHGFIQEKRGHQIAFEHPGVSRFLLEPLFGLLMAHMLKRIQIVPYSFWFTSFLFLVYVRQLGHKNRNQKPKTKNQKHFMR